MSAEVQSKPVRRSRGTGLLLGLTALGALVFLISIGGVVYLTTQQSAPKIEPGDWLLVPLAGPLTDGPARDPFVLDPSDIAPGVTEVARGIRAAAGDGRVAGLFLDVQDPMGGLATIQELRSAVVDFRASGKPCVAYAEELDFLDYYLASACTDVVMAPSGIALVNGLAVELTYFAGTLEKLGAKPQFEHVGDFKSATEPLERSEPSEAAREAYDALLDSTYGQIVSDIASSRGVDVEVVKGWIDHPALAPKRSLERGMVDAIGFRDAVMASLDSVGTEEFAAAMLVAETVEPSEDLPFVDVSDWLSGLEEPKGEKKIAVVYAAGTIVSGEGEEGMFGGGVLADRPFAEWMQDIRNDDSVAAVVLRVDSPGGSGLASDMMWREIKLTQKSGRPVVVSMGDYAASGGYYISAPADHIVAQRGTLTGSIGVFGGKMALAGVWENLRMTSFSFKRGAESDLLSSSTPFSDEGRRVFREFLQDFYDTFLDRVAEGRGMTRDAVHAVAQGRVWTGEQALAYGLVDELGGLDVAMAKAAELGSAGDDFQIEVWPKQKTIFEMLAEDLQGSRQALISVPQLDAGIRELALLDTLLAQGAVAMWPARLSWEPQNALHP